MDYSQKGYVVNNLSVMEQAIRVLWETDGGGKHRWDDLYEYPYNEWESNRIVARLRETATKLQKLFTEDVLPRSVPTQALKQRNVERKGTHRFTEPQVLAEIQHLITNHPEQVEGQIIVSEDTQTVQLNLTFRKASSPIRTLTEMTEALRNQELQAQNQKKREQLQQQMSVKKAELAALEREITRFS